MRWDRIDVPVPTDSPTGQTASYLHGSTNALLVDPADRTDSLDRVLRDRSVTHIAATHHHPDHVGAVAEYARETDATVWARRGRTTAFERATGITPDRTFSDGTTIPTDAGPVTVTTLPGHASEHVGFRTPDGVVSGDLAVADGSVVVGAPDGDMRAYLSSLRRVHAHDPPQLLPSHGPPISDPRTTIRRLLAHRLDRERRIRVAILAGASTPDEILDSAYEKDLSGVRDLARSTVIAHVEKLAVEGDIDWDGRRATITTTASV